jgi:hypothetical protein
LAPLAERLRAILLSSAKITIDETPAPVLDPGRGRTETGYFWGDRAATTGHGADPTRPASSTPICPGVAPRTG